MRHNHFPVCDQIFGSLLQSLQSQFNIASVSPVYIQAFLSIYQWMTLGILFDLQDTSNRIEVANNKIEAIKNRVDNLKQAAEDLKKNATNIRELDVTGKHRGSCVKRNRSRSSVVQHCSVIHAVNHGSGLSNIKHQFAHTEFLHHNHYHPLPPGAFNSMSEFLR